MSIKTPPVPPVPEPGTTEGWVIEDARARQRRHRRTGGSLLVAAVAVGVLIAGIAGGGGGGGRGSNSRGRPSGSGSAPGVSHAAASRAFPGAPSTQPNGYGVEDDACPLASPNRYLPARSGCVTVKRADVDGDGRPDLILVYSRLSRQPVSGYVGGTPPNLRRDFVPDTAFLKVVFANGTSVSTRIAGTGGTRAAAVDAIVRVNGGPGREIFLQVERVSSGGTDVAYGLRDGRLVPAGVMLEYGGDSATRAGFDCLPENPPRLIQRQYQLVHGIKLVGETIYGVWRETVITYGWQGPRLVTIARRTFTRRELPTAKIGVGCTKGTS